ncbi:MAG: hypothetical protein HY650_05390 [Acidobacteria bacterium]|nr:hypothetical protein [Acidobacteriota bacterium]
MNRLEMKEDALPQNLPTKVVGDVRRNSVREVVTAYAGLFTSFATLVCCALPALLVLLGFGLTSVLTFFTTIPGWEDLATYTAWLFLAGGILLAAGFYFAYALQRPSEGEVCEVPDAGRESACSTATRWNRRILWLSLLLYSLALVVDMWGIGWMQTRGYFNR